MVAFNLKKYETDAGTIVRIRISVEGSTAAGNVEPAGAIDDAKIFAFASNPGSKRKKALNARGVILGRTVGTAPDTFVRRTFLPILTRARLDAIVVNSAVTIGGKEYTVKDKISEA
jgi:hypothetical protein